MQFINSPVPGVCSKITLRHWRSDLGLICAIRLCKDNLKMRCQNGGQSFTIKFRCQSIGIGIMKRVNSLLKNLPFTIPLCFHPDVLFWDCPGYPAHIAQQVLDKILIPASFWPRTRDNSSHNTVAQRHGEPYNRIVGKHTVPPGRRPVGRPSVLFLAGRLAAVPVHHL